MKLDLGPKFEQNFSCLSEVLPDLNSNEGPLYVQKEQREFGKFFLFSRKASILILFQSTNSTFLRQTKIFWQKIKFDIHRKYSKIRYWQKVAVWSFACGHCLLRCDFLAMTTFKQKAATVFGCNGGNSDNQKQIKGYSANFWLQLSFQLRVLFTQFCMHSKHHGKEPNLTFTVIVKRGQLCAEEWQSVDN